MRANPVIEKVLASAVLILVGCFPVMSEAAPPAEAPVGGTKKKSNQGRLVFDGKEHKLTHAVAFSMGRGMRRVVLFSQQPIAVAELKAVLKESDDGVEFIQPGPHVRLYFNDEDKFVSYKIFVPGSGLGRGPKGTKSTFQIDRGHVRGNVVMDQPQIGFTKQPYHFKFDFDLPLIATPKSTPTTTKAAPTGPPAKKPAKRNIPAVAGDPLNAYALPLPDDAKNVTYTALVKQIKYSSPSNVVTVVGFLSKELKKMVPRQYLWVNRGWRRELSDGFFEA